MCPAGNIHRFIVDVPPEHESIHNGVINETEWDGETILMVNATDSGKDFVLDRIFLENWYGVRVDSFKYGDSIDFIQQCAVSSIQLSSNTYYGHQHSWACRPLTVEIITSHSRLLSHPGFPSRGRFASAPFWDSGSR